jgi:hypothetical protein
LEINRINHQPFQDLMMSLTVFSMCDKYKKKGKEEITRETIIERMKGVSL